MKKPNKMNIHRLPYKVVLFHHDKFNLGFWDHKNKDIVYLLTESIDFNNWSDLITAWGPDITKAWFGVDKIDSEIDRFSSIEQVKEHNDRVLKKVQANIVLFNKRHQELQNKINQYLSDPEPKVPEFPKPRKMPKYNLGLPLLIILGFLIIILFFIFES